MTSFSALCIGLAIILIAHGNATSAGRIARSPQFGGFSQAHASAQSGSFGFGRPRFFGPPSPGFRPGGPGGPPHGGFGPGGPGGPPHGGFGPGSPLRGGLGQGGSISISKSISISRGGTSQSSAQSSASGK